ncbi:MAG: hypothetical protein NWE99_08965 [Candidatus Bathyarchaeota archaeon]|nr:hypothetical protein [Candidatus Bathyarchaeota archaeon]
MNKLRELFYVLALSTTVQDQTFSPKADGQVFQPNRKATSDDAFLLIAEEVLLFGHSHIGINTSDL